MDKKIYLRENGISISGTKFVANSRIYEIQNISGASLEVSRPKNRVLILSCLLIGITFQYIESSLFILGGLLTAVALMSYVCFNTRYKIVLHLPTGHCEAFVTSDKNHAEKVLLALHTSLLNHNRKYKGEILSINNLQSLQPEFPHPNSG